MWGEGGGGKLKRGGKKKVIGHRMELTPAKEDNNTYENDPERGGGGKCSRGVPKNSEGGVVKKRPRTKTFSQQRKEDQARCGGTLTDGGGEKG